MLSGMFYCLLYNFKYDANVLLMILGKLPIFGKKIKKAAAKSDKAKLVLGILSELFIVLFHFALIIAYVFVFMYLPKLILSRYAVGGESGFETHNSITYFTVVLTCFTGSILNPVLFKTTDASYSLLKIFRIRPKTYFRTELLKRLCIELPAYYLAFIIFGLDGFSALYLAIIVSFARFAGETFNILVFRIVGKRFTDYPGTRVIVMLIALFIAYFVPYIRGCVPATHSVLIDPLTLAIIFFVAAIFIYYVWTYDGMKAISARIHTRKEFIGYAEPVDENKSAVENIELEEEEAETDIKRYENLEGYEYMNRLFFARNRSIVFRGISIKLSVIAVALFVAIVAVVMGNRDIVYKVISYSMPVMFFVVYCMCDMTKLCKNMFYHCDRYVLRDRQICGREIIAKNFFIRLRHVLYINGIPVMTLAIVYAVAGWLAGKEGSLTTVISVCVGIVLLGVFYTVYGLLAYYMFQPYNLSARTSNYIYSSLNILMYIGTYAIIFVDANSLRFTLCIGLAVAVILAGAVALISNIGYKTFKIRK